MAKHSVSSLLALVSIGILGWVLQGHGPALAESVNTDFANLRSEPRTQGRVITALPKGTSVDVLRREGDFAEIRVTRTGLSGWVYVPAQGWRPANSQTPTNISASTKEAAPVLITTTTVASPENITQPTELSPTASMPAAMPELRGQPANTSPPLAQPAVMDAVNALPRAQGPWTYPLENGDATRIPVDELRLEMDPLDASVLYRKDPYDRSTFPVRVHDGVGSHSGKVSVKGSFSRHFLKKSLLISLDKGETAHGRSRFALNAMATDPSQAREWLAWDLIHKLGMVAPKARYTRLFINGEFIGLYLDIEWMDAAMFNKLGLGDKEGEKSQFFESEGEGYCGNLSPASIERGDLCWNKITPRDGDMAPLAELVKNLNAVPAVEFDTWLESHFDAQSVIDWLVVNTLTQNGDTYNKNYFLHRSAGDRKWRVIPWDYDLAWGRVADPALPFPRMIYNGFFQYAFPPDLGAENPLKRKLFENPTLYARYKGRLAQVLEVKAGNGHPAAGWYEPQSFRQRLTDLAAFTRTTRASEKYPVPGQDSAQALLESLAFFNEWRGHALKATVLEKTVFDTPRWTILPPASVAAINQEQLRQRRHQRMDLSATTDLNVRHARTPLIDPLLGWPLGMATLREATAPVRLTLENAREAAPKRLPAELPAGRCIERTWFVTVKSGAPATLDMEFDYLHEASTRREVPDSLDESGLKLYWFDGQTWHTPPSHINGLANLVAVPDLKLAPDVLHRFVACTPAQIEEKPAGKP